MPSLKINPHAFLKDLRAGLDDPALMVKYNLSLAMLENLLGRLVKAQRISQEELDLRGRGSEKRLLIRRRKNGETIVMEHAVSVRALVERTVSSGLSLFGADLQGANLSEANLAHADLNTADLTEADLEGANLAMANLSGAILYGADLARADLNGADLSSADVSSADLSSASLSSGDLLHANFTGANLTSAKLLKANAGNCDFTGANLEGADFSYANLSGANLTGANTEGTNFEGVNMMFVTKNIIAQEKAQSDVKRDRFIRSPLGVVTLQFAWFVICPLGFFIFGSSLLWAILMDAALISLTILNYTVAIFQPRGWLLLILGGFQTVLCFVVSLIVGSLILH